MRITNRIILSVLLTTSVNFFAQELVTDRPDQTESSVTVEKNSFQIESGLAFENFDNGAQNNFIAPSTLLRYGISENIELRFVFEHQKTKVGLDGLDIEFNGLNDLEVGAKILVLKDSDKNTEIAFLSHVIIPTANDELTTDNYGVVNKLAISHSISNKISLGYNVGYDLVAKQNALTYSLAIGFSVSNVVGFYIEPYGSWAEQNKFESNFDTGFTYLWNPNFQLDISYGAGLNYDMHYVAAGFSWKIKEFFTAKKM
jgi:hypothetical protein